MNDEAARRRPIHVISAAGELPRLTHTDELRTLGLARQQATNILSSAKIIELCDRPATAAALAVIVGMRENVFYLAVNGERVFHTPPC